MLPIFAIYYVLSDKGLQFPNLMQTSLPTTCISYSWQLQLLRRVSPLSHMV